MIRQSFCASWTVAQDLPLFGFQGPPPQQVRTDLPYDAMIRQDKRENTASGNRTGYYPEGEWVYAKTFTAPAEWAGRYVALEFEGVYMNASVYLNGDRIAFTPYGYTDFVVNLTPYLRLGAENEVRVACKTYQDSRWYTGAGIYRDVHLYVADLLHIPSDGLHIHTEALSDNRAVAAVTAELANGRHRAVTAQVELTLWDPDGKVCGQVSAPVTCMPGKEAVLRTRIGVDQPQPWSPASPRLYRCTAVVKADGQTVDTAQEDFGLRVLGLDVETGLTLNGRPVNLRGGCIHHDNGVVGAATFSSMEERRVRIMKTAGFNAIRMAHHPASRALLRACDRVGMLVMDEFSDIWTRNKSKYDYALYFEKYWEQDVEAMVRKDYNHPSVILYSIGNEIPETGTGIGSTWGRMLAEKVRSLDATRYTTNAINALLSLADGLKKMSQQSGDINAQAGQMGASRMDQVMLLPEVAEITAESYAAVDIAGYNYMQARYLGDHDLYPQRIICGTEDFPRSIAYNWDIVERCPWVIGDFTWTGWDYLGECGPWPSSLNTGGDIDVTGMRRPCSYYREIVFGLTQQPALAVTRPTASEKTPMEMMWGWSDTLAGWSWYGHEGESLTVEVYCPGDEAELLLNGKSLGRRKPEGGLPHIAYFTVPFAPGELTAVSYRDGVETGRRSLHSAQGPMRLAAWAEDTSMLEKPRELVFIPVELQDAQGRVYHSAQRTVSVQVEGGAELLGFGSADGRSPEGFTAPMHSTFEGRAFCVLRRTSDAPVRAVFTCEGCAPAVVEA